VPRKSKKLSPLPSVPETHFIYYCPRCAFSSYDLIKVHSHMRLKHGPPKKE